MELLGERIYFSPSTEKEQKEEEEERSWEEALAMVHRCLQVTSASSGAILGGEREREGERQQVTGVDGQFLHVDT